MTGAIVRLKEGFGFIRGVGGREYFFHRSAVRGAHFLDLCEGDAVEFAEEPSERGPRATDVRLQGARP